MTTNYFNETNKEFNIARNMKIDYDKHVIVITQRMKAESARYGSEAYNTLTAACKDYPTYRLVVNKQTKRNKALKLDYKYMWAFINADKDETRKATNRNVFMNMCGLDENGRKIVRSATDLFIVSSYVEVREWFLNAYKEVADYIEKMSSVSNADEEASLNI